MAGLAVQDPTAQTHILLAAAGTWAAGVVAEVAEVNHSPEALED